MTDEHESSLEPAPFLVENIGILPVGLALDLAMGNGRNAIFLAQAGFSVTGVDISAAAVRAALAAAKIAQVKIEAEIADLESGYHIARNAYDVIICFNYLQRSLIPEIKEGLRPGGMVVYETYTIDQARFGRPHNPDHMLQYNELLEMFREFRCLRYREGIFEKRRAIASLIARKP